MKCALDLLHLATHSSSTSAAANAAQTTQQWKNAHSRLSPSRAQRQRLAVNSEGRHLYQGKATAECVSMHVSSAQHCFLKLWRLSVLVV